MRRAVLPVSGVLGAALLGAVVWWWFVRVMRRFHDLEEQQ